MARIINTYQYNLTNPQNHKRSFFFVMKTSFGFFSKYILCNKEYLIDVCFLPGVYLSLQEDSLEQIRALINDE